MGKSKDFIKDTIRQIWGGFLKNFGVLISAFIISGGYLVAINEIKQFQLCVRAIPTEEWGQGMGSSGNEEWGQD
jgi:hypothetical protein